MKYKICNTCGKEKTIHFFHKDYNEPDNRKSDCMKCFNKNKKKDAARKRHNILQNKRRKRNRKGIHLVLYKKRPECKTAQRIYRAGETPMFMQYNHLIYKYVKNKYSMSQSDIDLMLFAYPLCPFTRSDFRECRDIIGYKKTGALSKLKRDGLVYLWKKWSKDDMNPDLFDFTDEGKKLVRDMHYWALGKESIPECDNSIDIMAKLKSRSRVVDI